jgi:hypothetical protein
MHKVIGCINAENTCRLAHIGHAFQNATLAQPSITREVATVMIVPEKRFQRNRP